MNSGLYGQASKYQDMVLRSLVLSGDVSPNAPVLNISQTWNNSALAFTALKLNITNTASSETSKMLDIQLGGVSQIYLDTSGGLNMNGPAISARSSGGYLLSDNTSSTFTLSPTSRIGFTPNNAFGGPDVALGRNAIGVLEINSGTAGTFRDLILRAMTSSADITINTLTLGLGAGQVSTNVVLGASALTLNVTGNAQVAIGYQALKVVTGAHNTAVGYNALAQLTTGAESTAVGKAALTSCTTGTQNTAFGGTSLELLQTGIDNTAIGLSALHECVSGSRNVALGRAAGRYELGSDAFYVDNRDRTNTAGDKAGALLYGTFHATPSSQTLAINAVVTIAQNAIIQGMTVGRGLAAVATNTAFGVNVLSANTSGSLNVGIGYEALKANTTGANNVAVGREALKANLSGVSCVAIGLNAMNVSTSANQCIAIGASAMLATTTGSNSVAIGNSALQTVTTGFQNTAIGDSALKTTTGSNNVGIGRGAGQFETGSNALYIDNQDRVNTAGDKAGALLYGTFHATPSSQLLRINAQLSFGYSATPASASATGTAGSVRWDGSYLYICVSADTWQRVATATW